MINKAQRTERGQATVEYVAALAIATMIMIAVAAALAAQNSAISAGKSIREAEQAALAALTAEYYNGGIVQSTDGKSYEDSESPRCSRSSAHADAAA